MTDAATRALDPDGSTWAPVEIPPHGPGIFTAVLHHRHDTGWACAACAIVALRADLRAVQATVRRMDAEAERWIEIVAEEAAETHALLVALDVEGLVVVGIPASQGDDVVQRCGARRRGS